MAPAPQRSLDLHGSDERDIVAALAGSRGDDYLVGGDGFDTVQPASGIDTCLGFEAGLLGLCEVTG